MASHESRQKDYIYTCTDSIGNRMFLCFNFPLDIAVVAIRKKMLGSAL